MHARPVAGVVQEILLITKGLSMKVKCNNCGYIGEESEFPREAAEKAEADKRRAEAEEAARIRGKALRPDREKLAAVADVVDAIVVPIVSEASYAYREDIEEVLGKVANKIRAIVAEMR